MTKLISLLCTTALLSYWTNFSAAAIILNADQRLVRAQSDAVYTSVGSSDSDPMSLLELPSGVVGSFAPYSNSLNTSSAVNEPGGQAMASGQATTSQTSTISTTLFNAEGVGSGSSFSNIPGLGFTGAGSHNNNNRFNVVFTSTTPFNFSLNGTIEAIRSSTHASVSVIAGMIDTAAPTPNIFNFSIVDPTPSAFSQQTVINNHTGTLPAGQYEYSVLVTNTSSSINATTSSSGAYDLIFEITPIPEPSGLLLLLTGSIVVVTWRNHSVAIANGS